jgi:hypothetical protein
VEEEEEAIVGVEAATQSHPVATLNLTVGTHRLAAVISRQIPVPQHPAAATRHLPQVIQKQHITQKLTLHIRIQPLIPTPISTQQLLKPTRHCIHTTSQQTTTTQQVTTQQRS